MKIPNLNETVVEALEFISNSNYPELNIDDSKIIFVTGSGNALNTGKILFANQAAIFSDESNFKKNLEAYRAVVSQGLIDQAVIISASGEKDSVWEVEAAKEMGLNTLLLTCTQDSSASEIADQTLVYQKISEPYTYNYSTYMGMILGKTKESAKEILDFSKNLKFPKKFGEYESYAFIFPDKHGQVGPMVEIKRNELFGPHMALRAFTFGHARHAGFVHPWKKELVITIGDKNVHFGHKDHRWDISLPRSADYGLIISLAYYIVGKIQSVKNPYFKENIESFCLDYGPKAYGKKQTFEVIVPGTNI
ncbi:hypothetical protein ACFL1M_01220 [Patescibacteria group bacterium]